MQAQPSRPGYRFLPHTTDAYIEAAGQTLEEALEFAAMALIDTMCEINSVSARVNDQIHASGRDEITLLYDWLERILLKFELEGKVYSRFKVAHTAKSGTGFRADGEAFGERYDRATHGAKVEVKAVTYNRMEVTRGPGEMVTLRFILDL